MGMVPDSWLLAPKKSSSRCTICSHWVGMVPDSWLDDKSKHTRWQLVTKGIVSDIEFVETGEQPELGLELSRQVVAAEMQIEEVGEIAQRLSCLNDNTREFIVVQA